jgi:hypothetical protein
MTDLSNSDAICSRCHKSLPPTAKFCSECGAAATTKQAAFKILRLMAAFAFLGVLGAGFYWTDGFNLFRSDLGLEVTSRGGELVSVIDITNVKQSPIVINEVIVNGSNNDQCIAKPKRSLAEGNNLSMPAHKFFCGNLVRVTIRTDRGDRDYLFSQR